MSEFDDVIVGGGSAGLALATRLTEDPARRVLLIEAGPDVRSIGDVDVLSDQIRFSSKLTEWGIDASFVPGASINYPVGRKMGGGSAVNGAFAVRGIRDDYERWAALAGDEWSWPHMLRVLCRLEADQDFAGEYHGTQGPVPVTRWRRSGDGSRTDAGPRHPVRLAARLAADGRKSIQDIHVRQPPRASEGRPRDNPCMRGWDVAYEPGVAT